jgi:hypothetical protein
MKRILAICLLCISAVVGFAQTYSYPMVDTRVFGSVPATFTVGAGMGTGATIGCATNHYCDNKGGEVTAVTGTSPTTGANTVAFTATLYGAVQAIYPSCDVYAANSSGLSTVTKTVDSSTGFTRSLFGSSGLAASTAYTVIYICQ